LSKQPARGIDVYLEVGSKRTFAGALEWPGWCRAGRDEQGALQALADAGPRYARVLAATSLGFQAPPDTSRFTVVERLDGNATTDFGAPDVAPSDDARPIDEADRQRFETLLAACWDAFDAAAEAATGKELRLGPRGGGRDLEGIARHVMGAEHGYLARVAGKHARRKGEALSDEVQRTRRELLEALARAARGELPERGPRGGTIWPARYFVRRVAWHVVDHIWEIEDRSA
jgi:hypothetical protein